MHILVISHMYPSNIRPVAGVFVKQQIKALVRLGHRITVICPTPWVPKWLPGLPEDWKVFQQLPLVEREGRIEVYFRRGLVIPTMLDSWRGRLYFCTLYRFIKQLFRENNFDLIHAHTALTSGDLGQILKKKYKLPLVITMHGGDIYRKALISNKNYSRILNVLSKSNAVTVVSRKLKEKIIVMNGKRYLLPKIHIIYNGFDMECDMPSKKLNITCNSIKLISIGGLFRQKNYELVIQAVSVLIKSYPNIKYYIIGKGQDRYFYENKIKKLNLENVVFLKGSLPHAIAMSYLKDADIFILPSIKEGFGIAYLEAMYLGKITIGSSSEPIEEIMHHGLNGFLVNPNDPEGLIYLLQNILNGKYNLDKIRKEAIKTVWPRFCWDNNARAYETLYLSCLNEKKYGSKK